MQMASLSPTWTDLIIAVVSSVLGWFARYFQAPRPPGGGTT